MYVQTSRQISGLELLHIFAIYCIFSFSVKKQGIFIWKILLLQNTFFYYFSLFVTNKQDVNTRIIHKSSLPDSWHLYYNFHRNLLRYNHRSRRPMSSCKWTTTEIWIWIVSLLKSKLNMTTLPTGAELRQKLGTKPRWDWTGVLGRAD